MMLPIGLWTTVLKHTLFYHLFTIIWTVIHKMNTMTYSKKRLKLPTETINYLTKMFIKVIDQVKSIVIFS